MVYELRVNEDDYRARKEDFKAVELVFLKQGKADKKTGAFSGESLPRTIPRMEMFDSNLTILEVKTFIFNKVQALFKEDHPIHNPET